MPLLGPKFEGDSIPAERIGDERCAAKIWSVQSVSIFRLFAALLFASLAFQAIPVPFIACIYLIAMCTDLADGFLARRLHAESYVGKVVDLISDKSLTVVSLLYAAERGMALTPLALIATREIIVMGARAITVRGSQLLPTNRVFGGVMAFLVWSNTFFLLIQPRGNEKISIANYVYWTCAVVFAANLTLRLYMSRGRIRASLTSAE